MPKRKRVREQRPPSVQTAVADRAPTEQERAAALFVESVKAHEAADRVEQQRRRDAAARETQHEQLRAAKQAAAERIKRARSAERRGTQVIEAEAAYRLALAELQEFETGVRPHWAPPPPEPAEAPDVSGAEDATEDGTDE